MKMSMQICEKEVKEEWKGERDRDRKI